MNKEAFLSKALANWTMHFRTLHTFEVVMQDKPNGRCRTRIVALDWTTYALSDVTFRRGKTNCGWLNEKLVGCVGRNEKRSRCQALCTGLHM